MRISKLNELGLGFVKDKSLFFNHINNGIIRSFINTMEVNIYLLDSIDISDKNMIVEIQSEIVTALVYLKEYNIECFKLSGSGIVMSRYN